MNFVLPYRYFQVGGTPEHVIELLSKNYIGVAQMANMVAEWLILGGNDILYLTFITWIYYSRLTYTEFIFCSKEYFIFSLVF